MAGTAFDTRPDDDTDSGQSDSDYRPGAIPAGGDRQPPSAKTTSSAARYGGAMRVNSGEHVMRDSRGGLGRLEPTPKGSGGAMRVQGSGLGYRQPTGSIDDGSSRMGSNRALSSNALSMAEGAMGAERQNLYRKAGLDEAEAGIGGGLKGRIRGISRRKKLLSAAGVGGIAGLLIALMFAAPAFRIPGIMSEVEDKVGAEVDHIVEVRAERMVVNYLIRRALGGSMSDYVITGSPLSDIWRTFQSRRIEKRIFNETGILFEKDIETGVVHISYDGRDLGHVRNYEEVMRIINKGTIDTKKEFKTIIKSVIPAVRMHKASIEAKSFKNRYLKGKPYGTPEKVEKPGKEGQLSEDVEQTVEALTAQQIDQSLAANLPTIDAAEACFFDGEQCDQFSEEDPSAKVPDPDSDTAKRVNDNGSLAEVQQETADAANDARKDAIKDRTHGFINRMLEKILTKIIGEVATKAVIKAIPWVGWVDLAADIQHAMGNVLANDLIHRIPVILREAAYGVIYTSWAGYSDQQKAGRLPASQNAALNQQLAGAEKGAAYSFTFYGNQRGTPVSPKVGSNTFYATFDILNDIYNNLGFRIIVRGPLEAWYYTVGKLLKLVGGLGADAVGWIGKGVKWLMDFTGFTAAANQTLKDIFGDNWQQELAQFAVKVVFNLFALIVDPLAKGAELMNNIFTGAAVAMNFACKTNLGCRAITGQTGVYIGQELQQEQDEEMQMTPLKDRLFDTTNPDSVASTFLRNQPTNPKPDTIVSSLFSMAGKLPTSLVSAFSPRVRASANEDMANLTGVLWYGASDADLAQDVSPEVRQQQDGKVQCPKTDPSIEFNACQADETVINSLKCAYEDCPEFKDGN